MFESASKGSLANAGGLYNADIYHGIRLAAGALRSPQSLEALEKQALARVRAACPEVEWVSNYATLGPWDYLDIFRAPDIESAMKVATLIRTFGLAHTEVWAGTEWPRYKEMVRHLPSAEAEES